MIPCNKAWGVVVDTMLKKCLERAGMDSWVMAEVSLKGHTEVTHAKDMGRHSRAFLFQEKGLGRHKSRSICSKTMSKSTNS